MTTTRNEEQWETVIRADEELVRELQLEWLEQGEGEALRSFWLETWNQVPYDEVYHSRCRERLLRSIPVARGITRSRFLSGNRIQMCLVLDPEEPEVPWISLASAIPPLFWARGGANPADLRKALEPYLVEHPLKRISLPRVVRLASPLEMNDPLVIRDSVEKLELWMDDRLWHSSFDDDPWVGIDGNMSMIDQTQILREVTQEHPGRFPSMSFRTLWSRAILTIEQHPKGVWVFELRYVPAGNAGTIERNNELTRQRLPHDLPVDLAASLLRAPCYSLNQIEELRDAGEHPIALLALKAAIEPSELAIDREMRAVAKTLEDDEGALGDLIDLAYAYQHDRFVFELTMNSKGALKEDLEALLCRPQFAGGAS